MRRHDLFAKYGENSSEQKYDAICNILYWLAQNIYNQGFESTDDRLDNNLNQPIAYQPLR